MNVKNPIIGADMPDPDVIRVGDTYYMVSTTMFYIPGAPILKSKDLCNWEIISYIFDIIDENEFYKLENGKHAYGKGQWATSLTYYKGLFYACFVCHDMGKTYIFHTDDINRSGWDRLEIDEVFHDMSFLFWEGTPYLVYGNGEIYIIELKKDLSGIQKGGLKSLLLQTPKDGMLLRCEGCRAIVRDGYIYLLFIDWPNNGGRREICYRSRELMGPYESRVLLDDDFGFTGHGVAQGTLIDSEKGDWYAILFQDRGASGRIPYLLPADWKDAWPVIGLNGKIPDSFDVPFQYFNAAPLVCSDSFNHKNNELSLTWQWNHNPDHDLWSFTQRQGYLRLTTGHIATGLMDARNTLTQRTMEPGSICDVMLDTTGMKEGDYAGLCAFQGRYGQIGVRVKDNERLVETTQKKIDGSILRTSTSLKQDKVYLRVVFDYRYRKDEATFLYSLNGAEWNPLGEVLPMEFTLDIFVGYRIGLFNYATKNVGGFADFKDFTSKLLKY